MVGWLQRKRKFKWLAVGEYIFYRFTDLCSFDPVHDLTIDAMHAVVLNLVKTELENHLLADLGPNLRNCYNCVCACISHAHGDDVYMFTKKQDCNAKSASAAQLAAWPTISS